MSIAETYKQYVRNALPQDENDALLVGRVWRPDVSGPAVVMLHEGHAYDISSVAATVSTLCEKEDLVSFLTAIKPSLATDDAFADLGPVKDLLENTILSSRDVQKPWVLSPIDLQSIKAAGVTFATSMLERVIEEKAGGDPAQASNIRAEIEKQIGGELAALEPGSDEAAKLKSLLIDQDLWSQYLEVGIGPDAETFTKAQILSSVGSGEEAGVHPMSSWNNPEPEIVLAVTSAGKIIGATLGNDVNLRDVEGRSALLLGKAKDNNASCALGPFIRIFDEQFTLDTVRTADVTLRIEGEDGYVLDGVSSMAQISRDPADIVGQLMGAHHQYPDGVVLFLGTMFAPTQDRGETGRGFTHHVGDVVSVSSPALGQLTNQMNLSTECQPWSFGVRALMENLAKRDLL